MKILSRALLIAGAVVLVAAIGVLTYGGLEVWKQFIALSANRSRDFVNPVTTMLGGASLALVAGFLGGLGLGLPRKNAPDAAQPAAPTTPNPPAGPNPDTLR